ncbi:RNA helicase [Leptospira wolffii]|uniref:RNA helicase n=1 Tax=Leptospira wolffii TaxID=409998 RepID=A0A2M9Z6U5_9LEPT|nr:AAA domain-containing protein [Leptospira wolffii]PJZ64151.1 RNA helicase [Leptospira wolffii]TGK56859.1 RNA helicase [Leptospira wolffii]TGK71559.1 RNA helicase [Leptospira wolffii]TGK75584.1 RNA helicase [Leptospira wolffii]TGL32926.1 RNA helicase [Leptospira wolffii]
MESHYEFLRESLQKERNAELERYKAEISSSDLQTRVRTGLTIFPLVFEDAELGPDGNWKVLLKPTKPGNTPELFRTGTPVRILKDTEDYSSVLLKASDDSYLVSMEEVPEWVEEGKLALEILPDETSYREWDKGLEKILSAPKGTRAKFFADLFSGKISLSSPHFKEEEGISFEFNESQRRAISAVLETEDFVLVHGPPGTGKTKTLVEAIRLLVEREKKVLASAPTNAASDLLVESLSKIGVPVLRIGHPARIHPAVLENSLELKLIAHPDAKLLERDKKEVQELLKKARKYKRNFGREEAEERRRLYKEADQLRKGIKERQRALVRYLLDSHPVIVCTHTGASSHLLENRSFDYAILDEGSQAIEPASWLPILKAEKVVIAGDPFQLPPTVLSEDPLLKISLMERLLSAFPEKDRVFLLDTQYRMTDPIQEFPNRTFYEGQLKSGLRESERNFVVPEISSLFGSSLVFLDSSGTDTAEETFEGSLGNPWEADFVFGILKRILDSGVSPERIAILTPYRYQRYLIKNRIEELSADRKNSIEVETVDSFQGREMEIVLFSLVRSNPEGQVGFLSERRRWNVGMTRAKRLLVMVGDGSTVGQDEFFRDLIGTVEEKGESKTAWEFLD